MSITDNDELIINIDGRTRLISKQQIIKAFVEPKANCANYEKDNVDPIVESVRTKLLDRSQVGIKKYGEQLGNYSKYNFIIEMQNEALDFANYCEVELQKEETINQLVKKYHNDQDLGKAIRKLYS